MDIQDHINVGNKYLTKEELLNIEGGIKITASLINYLTKGVSVILDLGRSLGSSIRRISSRGLCRI